VRLTLLTLAKAACASNKVAGFIAPFIQKKIGVKNVTNVLGSLTVRTN